MKQEALDVSFASFCCKSIEIQYIGSRKKEGSISIWRRIMQLLMLTFQVFKTITYIKKHWHCILFVSFQVVLIWILQMRTWLAILRHRNITESNICKYIYRYTYLVTCTYWLTRMFYFLDRLDIIYALYIQFDVIIVSHGHHTGYLRDRQN